MAPKISSSTQSTGMPGVADAESLASSSFGAAMRRGAAWATMLAGLLVPAESARGQEAQGQGPLPMQGGSLQDAAGKAAAAAEQWKAWRSIFKGNIPTESLGVNDLERITSDSIFRVSEQATLQMPLTFLVGFSSGGNRFISKDRFDVLARNSTLSRPELEKEVWEAFYAQQTAEDNDRKVLSAESDIFLMQRFKQEAERLSQSIGTIGEEVTEMTAQQAKVKASLDLVQEAESLLAKQSAGRSLSEAEAAQLKRLCRKAGLRSLDEAQESRELLVKAFDGFRGKISTLEGSRKKASQELEKTLLLADAEACENYERLSAAEANLAALRKSSLEHLAKTEKIRNLQVSAFVDPKKRESFRLELAAVEVTLKHDEYTAFNSLGNPSAKLIVLRGRSNEPRLLVAANEPQVRVSAEDTGKGLSLFVGKHERLHMQRLDEAASLKSFIDGSNSLVFAEKGSVTSLGGDEVKSLYGIDVRLCQGASFDISKIGDQPFNITPTGGGTITLGQRPSRAERKPRVEIDARSATELVTISIPAREEIIRERVEIERRRVTLDLQAKVDIELRGPSSEDSGVDVDIEVRGATSSTRIPFVRDGKLVDANIDAFIAKVGQVQ